MLRRIAVFSVVCGLLIPPFDSLQIAVGVESIGTKPWMTPIQFVIVGAFIAIFSPLVDPRPKPEPLRALVASGAMFGGGYLCTLTQAKGGTTYAICYYVILIIVLGWRAKTAGVLKETLGFAILLAIIGPLAEALKVHAGGFQYFGPTVLGVPIWLPLQYASAGPLVRGLAAETTPSGAPGPE